jgi:arginase
MPNFTVIDAPNILGLKPNGVERLPEALKAAGLMAGLNAEYAGRVESLPYNPQRDPETLILNPDALRAYALRLAAAVTGVLQHGRRWFNRARVGLVPGRRTACALKVIGSLARSVRRW